MISATGRQQQKLWKKASLIRDRHVGGKVYFRGLIEFSNVCENDCYYCGIRSSLEGLKRYTMTVDEIMECAAFCLKAGYGSLVLQSGQQRGEKFVSYVGEVIRGIKKKFPELGITLCAGEQDEYAYRKFFKAGAHRYLLRIETSDRNHYRKLHPGAMLFENRVKSLEILREIGYQVGTGVMICSPGQSIDNLADDIMFMKKMDIDMAGMGPYVPNKGSRFENESYSAKNAFSKSLNMIAALRLVMPDINIASVTALQALDPEGREKGLQAGANVIMPVLTPGKYRSSYLLYDNKPCVDETKEDCFVCIKKRVENAGMNIGEGEWGDSPHFFKRREKEEKCL